MGQAQPKPERDPMEKAELFIATYQERYSSAVTNARAAATTTQTAAWQTNYRHQVNAHREKVNQAVWTIRNTADLIKSHDTDEDSEKAIKDAVKSLIEERIRFAAWQARTVAPYRDTVDACAAQMLATRRAAQEAEGNQPLIDRGLLEAVQTLLEKWPVAKWDEDNGVVTVE